LLYRLSYRPQMLLNADSTLIRSLVLYEQFLDLVI